MLSQPTTHPTIARCLRGTSCADAVYLARRLFSDSLHMTLIGRNSQATAGREGADYLRDTGSCKYEDVSTLSHFLGTYISFGARRVARHVLSAHKQEHGISMYALLQLRLQDNPRRRDRADNAGFERHGFHRGRCTSSLILITETSAQVQRVVDSVRLCALVSAALSDCRAEEDKVAPLRAAPKELDGRRGNEHENESMCTHRE